MSDKWLDPSYEAADHRRIVALYYIKNEEEDDELQMEILTFNGLNNTFCGRGGWPKIKLKEIIGWIPIPDYD